MTSFADRIVRAARLDASLYEEVERDPQATNQAFALIVLSNVAAGVGTLFPGAGLEVLFWGLIASLLGWVAWAAIIYAIGTKVLPEAQTSSSVSEILRVLGFASAPGLLRIFGVFHPIRGAVLFVVFLWMLAAMVVAVRQALDYRSTVRAAGVCALGWMAQILVIGLLLWLNGILFAPPLAD